MWRWISTTQLFICWLMRASVLPFRSSCRLISTWPFAESTSLPEFSDYEDRPPGCQCRGRARREVSCGREGASGPVAQGDLRPAPRPFRARRLVAGADAVRGLPGRDPGAE